MTNPKNQNSDHVSKKGFSPIILISIFLLFWGAAGLLLGKTSIAFMTWWLLIFLMGIAFMPLTAKLFCGFADKGWMFSKILSIAVTGFLTWYLAALKIVPFHTITCVAVVLLCSAAIIIISIRSRKVSAADFPLNEISYIVFQEVLFFFVFLLWTYIAGFRPETSNSTEKFMDYGFMEAMMRSTTLPPKDIWYSQGVINYYYGGQYFAVFLTKLTGTSAEITYNIARALVAAFAFSLPCSISMEMIRDRLKLKVKARKLKIYLAGIISGVAVCFAGNMHYPVYGVIKPLIEKLKGLEVSSYWFPDATRYIGFNPEVANDRTIHEFPCYSFVLGDLHAHVVNIMFVLLLLGLLYAWVQQARKNGSVCSEMNIKQVVVHSLSMPYLYLAGWLLGIYHFTNFWDFVIYFVVTGGVTLFLNVFLYKSWKKVLLTTAIQAFLVVVISTLSCLPFTLHFKSMVDGVALAQHHTMLHQLAVLWGFPSFVVIVFLIRIFKKLRDKSFLVWLEEMHPADYFAVIIALCALGLVFLPEVVYVRDIYEGSSARANTMFKLTYQAFIMFGICMGYMIVRMMFVNRKFYMKVLGLLSFAAFLFSFTYFGKAVDSWYGNIFRKSDWQGLNTTAFVEMDYSEDASAIRWLKKNIKGQPVVLEANGDSYSRYCRVSAMTGLPTVLGWYVHEWLWRSDVGDVNQKSTDVETIYTSSDAEEVRRLIEQYDISYIFVGSMEREKYQDRLNLELLNSFGKIIYGDSIDLTYIIQIDR